MNLNGRKVLVTGGAVRIGRTICEMLAGQGCIVGVHYNKSMREAMALLLALKAQGCNSFAVQADLSSDAECNELIDAAWEEAGGLDVLINNAAMFIKDTEKSVPEEAAEMMRVNYNAPVALSKRFAEKLHGNTPQTLNGGPGHIVNLLDRRIAGDDGESFSYTKSKKLLAEFTLSAAREFAPDIAVNGVAPGAVLPPPSREGALTRELAGNKLLLHKCTPQDVASAVVFLLESEAITGQIIYVDSGQHLL